MKKVVNYFSKVCVGIPGLIFFNVLVATICIRFLRWAIMLPEGFGKVSADLFYDMSAPVAVRLVTVGVLILERHEILEITGLIPKGDHHDSLSEQIHPFGIFYLCFGLLMECLTEQTDLLGKFFSADMVMITLMWISLAITTISLVSSIQQVYLLIRHKKLTS